MPERASGPSTVQVRAFVTIDEAMVDGDGRDASKRA